MLLNSKKRKRSLLMTRLMCCLSSLYLANAHADEFDTLQFSAAVNRTWDNNLFRLSNNEISDQITTYNAGVKLDKSYSQQRFIVNLNYIDNKYQTNEFLDFNTLNYDAAWQWTLTPALTGTISSATSKSLAGFADFRSRVQNIRTNKINQFRAEYSPHKVWALIAGITESSATNSQTFNAIPNFDFNAFDYGARYNFSSGTSVSFLGHSRSGEFNRDLNALSLFDNGYTENEYEVDVTLKASGKSNLTTKLAYLSRNYDNFSQRDYDSWLGYVRYDVLLTGKLKFNAELSRTIGQFDTPYSSYTASDALTTSLSYFFSEKLTLGLNSRYAQRDFKNPVFSGLPSRTDEEKSFGVALTWQPIKNVGLILNTSKSSRDASSGYNSFDYNDVTSSLTLDLKI
ncbi:outer membrane beta-barrel protein [Methylophilus sp. 13]|uniref:XrtB/PEP-CTERM-associated polysaccharide biosynthesis outer membrane protein EpsL n=1 Tax=Methylophilus sp. 13 TaxID=2781018 RepID=UPI00188FF0BA|nr:XrtB/PEP-CTERM-associated polysaccharide biosynthesis outer membrane protein EpsL [Methylophilus sp. 13]MBF5038010.1 outer membrane beta-barrel protein [Methylophilus sp. 13]